MAEQVFKRGKILYKSNPSIPQDGIAKRKRAHQIGSKQKGLILDGKTGEMFSEGIAIGYEFDEVDTERFVKLFAAIVNTTVDMSKAGLAVFWLVYRQVRENPGTDEIKLNQYLAEDEGMSLRTYQRGLKDLLDREVIFKSTTEGVFFINIQFMFNGDRIAFVKGYQLKEQPKKRITRER